MRKLLWFLVCSVVAALFASGLIVWIRPMLAEVFAKATAGPVKVDVVVVLDSSTEMAADLKSLRFGWQEFAAALKHDDVDARFALIRFGQQAGDAPITTMFADAPFTADAGELTATLAAIEPGPAKVVGKRDISAALAAVSGLPSRPEAYKSLVLLSRAASDDLPTTDDLRKQLKDGRIDQLHVLAGAKTEAALKPLADETTGLTVTLADDLERRSNLPLVMPALAVRTNASVRAKSPLFRWRPQMAHMADGISIGVIVGAFSALGIACAQRLGRGTRLGGSTWLQAVLSGIVGGIACGLTRWSAANWIPADAGREIYVVVLGGAVLGGWLGARTAPRLMPGLSKLRSGSLTAAAAAVGAYLGMLSTRFNVSWDRTWFEALGLSIALGTALVISSARSSRLVALQLAGGRRVMLSVGAKIMASDLYPSSNRNSPDAAVAEVSRSPHDLKILGLKNLTKFPWSVRNPQGQSRKIDPGRSIQIAVGTRINFGSAQAEMVAAE